MSIGGEPSAVLSQVLLDLGFDLDVLGAESVDGFGEHLGLFFGEISFGFLIEDGQQINVVLGHLRSTAFKSM